MKSPKEELRLIMSESEMRVGMLVEVKGGPDSGRYLLLNHEITDPGSGLEGCSYCKSFSGWRTAPKIFQNPSCFCRVIGRSLYEVRERGQDDETERRQWNDLVKDADCRIRKPSRIS